MYNILATFHVLAALVWLGGLLFLGMVGAPVLRRLDQPTRARIFESLGVRFRTVGWVAIAVLVSTGVEMVRRLGVFSAPSEFWRTGFGRALLAKWAVVGVMLVIAVLHDFHFGPRARAEERARRGAVWLGRANALLGVALVYFAVIVAHRGG